METVTTDIRLDGRLAVRTRPADPGPWPGIVMLHEAWGVDDVMRRLADRLAGFGYIVHLPDLLGEGPWLRCIRQAFRAFQHRTGKPFELIESCRQQLVDHPDSTGKVGVIGFCFGGGFALLVSGDGFDASAVNYGPVPEDIDTVVQRSARWWPATAPRIGWRQRCPPSPRRCGHMAYRMTSRSIPARVIAS
jgi:carboxymethylenebutenolidase